MAAFTTTSALRQSRRTLNSALSLIRGSNLIEGPVAALPCTAINQKRSYQQTKMQSDACPRYGGRHTATLMTGDGVSPELLGYVQEIFRYAGAPIDFEVVEIDAKHNTEEDMQNALLSVRRNGIALKGNFETKYKDPSFVSMNVRLRAQLELFASIVKCRSVPGLELRHNDIDCVLIRENREGEYTSMEHESVPGVVESLKIITAKKSLKIARFAFDYAVANNRKKVTAIHKANIMKLADGLFLQCCKEVSRDYPDIEFNDLIIDNASMQMVSKPGQFDVLVMPNLYGNILTNIASGLIGGAGLTAGMNIGEKYAVFEAGTRHSGKGLKGKNIANPFSVLFAGCDMLEYLGHLHYAKIIRDSMWSVTKAGIRTPDLGGDATTLDVVKAVIDDVKPKTSAWKAVNSML